MSNPGEQPASEPTLIEQEGALPETVNTDPPAPVADEPAENTAPEAEAVPAEEAKPKKTMWYQTRIDEITKARREAERKAAELEAKLYALQKPDDGEATAFDPTRYDQDVQTAAERIIAQREAKGRTESLLNAGSKDFGHDAFTEKCNIVAAMGAGDSVEFMQIVTDPDIVPDGHRIIAALADNPDEAARILALKDNPVKMAAALAKFGASAKAPEKPLSSAPTPIRPIGGAAKAAAPADTDDIKTWMAKRKAEVAARNSL